MGLGYEYNSKIYGEVWCVLFCLKMNMNRCNMFNWCCLSVVMIVIFFYWVNCFLVWCFIVVMICWFWIGKFLIWLVLMCLRVYVFSLIGWCLWCFWFSVIVKLMWCVFWMWVWMIILLSLFGWLNWWFVLMFLFVGVIWIVKRKCLNMVCLRLIFSVGLLCCMVMSWFWLIRILILFCFCFRIRVDCWYGRCCWSGFGVWFEKLIYVL